MSCIDFMLNLIQSFCKTREPWVCIGFVLVVSKGNCMCSCPSDQLDIFYHNVNTLYCIIHTWCLVMEQGSKENKKCIWAIIGLDWSLHFDIIDWGQRCTYINRVGEWFESQISTHEILAFRIRNWTILPDPDLSWHDDLDLASKARRWPKHEKVHSP